MWKVVGDENEYDQKVPAMFGTLLGSATQERMHQDIHVDHNEIGGFDPAMVGGNTAASSKSLGVFGRKQR